VRTEAEAIAALRTGDPRGLDTLLRLYQARATRLALGIVGELESARDAVADSYRGIHQYDEARPFEPWFLRIVTNEALRIAERSARLVTGPDAEEALGSLRARGDDHDPVTTAERGELRALVRTALAALGPEDRAVLVLRYYLDLRESDVAQAVGRNPGEVHVRLVRARQRLLKLIQPRADFEGYLPQEEDE
jgi:RNA polymerase sigma-70 factor (ECF subfamily)